MHCRAGTMPGRRLLGRFAARTAPREKARIDAPKTGTPYALANVTGCPEGKAARQTPRALLYSGLEGKVGEVVPVCSSRLDVRSLKVDFEAHRADRSKLQRG